MNDPKQGFIGGRLLEYGEDAMKKRYSRPEMVEYGSLTQLTLGGGDTSIDASITTHPLSIGIGSGNGSLYVNGSCVHGPCS